MNKQREKFYRIEWKNSAIKSIKVVPKNYREELIREIEKLSINPLLGKKLQGSKEEFRRIRISNYRIIYYINYQTKSIIIVKFGHRKDIYRQI